MATMKEGLKRVVYEYNGAKPTPEIIPASSASPREKKEDGMTGFTRGAAEISGEM
jgi:hypothetical protein